MSVDFICKGRIVVKFLRRFLEVLGRSPDLQRLLRGFLDRLLGKLRERLLNWCELSHIEIGF